MVKPITFSLKRPVHDSIEVRYGKQVLRNVSKSVLPPGTVITAEDGTLYVGQADGSLRRKTPKLSKKERRRQQQPVKRVSSPRRNIMKVLRHKEREQPEDGQIASILGQLGRISRGEHNDSNLALKALADCMLVIIPYELVDELEDALPDDVLPEPKTDDTPPTGETPEERALREQLEVAQAEAAKNGTATPVAPPDGEKTDKDGFVIDPDDEK